MAHVRNVAPLESHLASLCRFLPIAQSVIVYNSLRSKLAGKLFGTLFLMIFRARLYKDFQYDCAQKGHFLQRCKSVCSFSIEDSQESTTGCKDME